MHWSLWRGKSVFSGPQLHRGSSERVEPPSQGGVGSLVPPFGTLQVDLVGPFFHQPDVYASFLDLLQHPASLSFPPCTGTGKRNAMICLRTLAVRGLPRGAKGHPADALSCSPGTRMLSFNKHLESHGVFSSLYSNTENVFHIK